jgi:4-amino-4-deoxy-L-arabinose transferase-like glycosyltransferase
LVRQRQLDRRQNADLGDHRVCDVRDEVVVSNPQGFDAEASPAGGLSSVRGRTTPGRSAAFRRWALPTILVVALLIRIAVIAADSGYQPHNDAFEYDYIAHSLADGEGFPRSGYLLYGGPSAIRGPGYPLFLAGVYLVSGDSMTAGRVAGALLGALAVWLIFLIVRRIWGFPTALAAAALAAVFPPLVLLSRDLLSESLFIALELAAVLCVLNFRRAGGAIRWALAAGALCGLAALTRNTAFALVVAIPVGLCLGNPLRSPGLLVAPAVGLAAAAIVIAPWTIRNAVEFHAFVPLTTSSGITSAGTYNQASYGQKGTHGAWRDPQIVPEFESLFKTRGLEETEVDSKLRGAARHFAWQHPGYVGEVFGWNLMRLFEIEGGSVVDSDGSVLDQRGIGSADPLAERIGLAIAGLLALAGIAALVVSRRAGSPARRVPRGPLFYWLIPVLTIFVTAFLNGLPRDRVPTDPFLLTLAAIGLIWVGSTIFRPRPVPA